MDDVETLRQEIERLNAQVASLRQQLRVANDALARLRHQHSRRFRDDYDHLPYDEDDRR